MSSGSIVSKTTISSTFARWNRFLIALIVLLVIETLLAATIRFRVLWEWMIGQRPFGFVEAMSLGGILIFPVMLFAIVRVRVAQKDLDLMVSSEQEAAQATQVLLDTTTEGIYGIDLQGCCTLANRAAGDILGYAPEDMIGQHMYTLIHHAAGNDSDRTMDSSPISDAMASGEPRHVDDETLWRNDGSSFSASYSVAPIVSAGVVQGAVVSFRNIEERKRMEAALRDSERQTRRFLEDLPLAVFIVDEDGRPIYSNHASVELLGVEAHPSQEPDELPDVYQVYKAGTIEPYEPDRLPVIRALKGETVMVDDVEIRRPDGSLVPLEVWARPIYDDDGRIRYAAAAFSDISERREAEKTLHAAQQEAERANVAKSEFLSRMSHELRTPLNAILGFTQLLEMEDLQPEQRESTAQIMRGGRRLLELINEVLDIARIESGRLSLSLEAVMICDLIDECIGLIRPLASERDITIDWERPKEEEHVLVDRHRLGQVLLNLLSNSVKYNVAGGTVTVTSAIDKEGWLRVGVTDTGPGIPSDKIPLLFTPFERLGAQQSGIEGTGLGLALSKNLVEAMGGRLLVDSMEGQGTTFWIEVVTTDQPQVEPLEHLPEDDGEKRLDGEHRVLYIEDNLANLKLIERLLAKRSEFVLLSAMSGTLGIDLARQHVPDIILLDLGLPDIRGDEVLLRLRKDPRTSQIPIVILSADATKRERTRLLATGAADYLTKPIDVAEFMRVLEKNLSIDA